MEHVELRGSRLFCANCGNQFDIPLPLPIDEVTAMMKSFETLHARCPKTYKEPTADETATTYEKAMWWLHNGETGLSSMTMWNCLIGNKKFPVHHPWDPDDFKRCYKLLQTVPEWKADVEKLSSLSLVWARLVSNWETLTSMYEQNVQDNWENRQAVGMYEFMKKLIDNK